jgi:hypothetical protein
MVNWNATHKEDYKLEVIISEASIKDFIQRPRCIDLNR